MLIMLTHRGIKPENHSLGFEASLGYGGRSCGEGGVTGRLILFPLEVPFRFMQTLVKILGILFSQKERS